MCNLFLSVFLCYPVQDTSTSVIIEVHIDIRKRDTVRIKETLKQKVILDRVNLCNTKTVCHSRSCCRSTSRAHRNIKLVSCGRDKILYNKEVTRETHGLHNMQLKLYSLAYFLIKHFAITTVCTIVCQFCQIIGFKLDTI